MAKGAPQSRGSRICNSIIVLLRQFFLILGKNFLLQFRRPIGTIFEILVPILAVLVLVGLRLGIPGFQPEDRCFVTFPPDPATLPFVSSSIMDIDKDIVYYAPNNTNSTMEVANFMEQYLAISNTPLIGVETQQEFIDIIEETESPGLSACFYKGAGVYFEDLDSDNIKYSIRLRQDPAPEQSWNTRVRSSNTQPPGARVTPNSYLNEGFLQLQKVIDESIIAWKTNGSVAIGSLNVNVQQFPYPKYREDLFLQIINTILPLFIILSFIYSAGVLVKELVLEKETRIRETMRMMGLSNWILVTTWFIKQLIFYLIPILIMVVLLKFGQVFPNSNFFLLLLFFVMFVVSGIAFCFLISVWFSSARIGLMAGFLIWFIAYFPYLFLAQRYEDLSLGAKVGICLVSNTCVGFGTIVISFLELRQEGLLFSNFATPLSLDDSFNMGWVVFMLFIDTIIYMLLYWYIDAVKPGKYGIRRPFYFLFLPSYWCGINCGKKPEELAALTDASRDQSAFEREPTNLDVGIAINGLTKIYNRTSPKRRKVAVDNLSLNMYKGQITALLGHNGAGKTTTMSMLTGLFSPTAGTAHINGYSITNEMDLIRHSLGICPQHNVLFDRLTVAEHLAFFAMLKGLPTRLVGQEVTKMIEDLQLTDKRKIQSQKLSGGMKRKLSVGIALVGGSEIIVLDEPTSGMDPYARRATWDLLVKHKEGRTMLLTTHFMDEADLLGDRIAIMAEGKLKCSGSSLFLKSRYGVGYHMTMVKEQNCDSLAVSGLVTQVIRGAEQVTDVGAELSFILPSQSIHQFPQLFDILESRSKELGISSFGVSVTTMEEVFIKVGQGEDETLRSRLQSQLSNLASPGILGGLEDPGKDVYTVALPSSPIVQETETRLSENRGLETARRAKGGTSMPVETSDIEQMETGKISTGPSGYGTFNLARSVVNTGSVLWIQQFYAMFVKRFYNSIRFWASIIWQLIIPLLFVLWGLILGVTIPGINSDSPSRVLTLENSALSDNITFFYAQFGSDYPIMFDSTDGESLGITDFFNYTGFVEDIRNNVGTKNNISSCCTYDYQILDKYCGTRNTMEYLSAGNNEDQACDDNDSFGYKSCVTDCLGCSEATEQKLSSCTNLLFKDRSDSVTGGGTSNSFCPVPPSVSFLELEDTLNPTGPLDGYDVYVAEKLLQVSGEELNVNDFFLRFQGGFVLQPIKQPFYTPCWCRNEDVAEYYDTISSNCNLFISNSSLDDYSYLLDICVSNQSKLYTGMEDCDECVGTASVPIPQDMLSATVWYNNQPYHMPPAALNGFYNIYLKQVTGNNNLSITVTNDPLPRSLENEVDDSQSQVLGFLISSTSVFGLSFLFASFIIFLVQEKDSKAKHIQFVSGVQASSYWLSTFAFDLLNALIPSILAFILFAAFNLEGYRGENLAAIFLLLLLSNWSAIPLSYLFSFLFSNALVAFALMVVFYYFVSLVLQVIIFVLVITDPDTAEHLHYIFLLHPTFALAIGLSDMYTNQGVKSACTQSDLARILCEMNDVNYADSVFEFKRPAIGHIFLYLFIEGLLFIILTILIERQFFWPEITKFVMPNKNNRLQNEPTSEDDDVAAERRKVASININSDNDEVVIIENLVKVYNTIKSAACPCIPSFQTGAKLAVDHINLVIPLGECFGLLGVNGAGKTTTFKMLTGDISPSGGTAKVAGYDIKNQLRLVQQHVGYCPQFDAIIDRLTGRELLTMFARLRGIPEKEIKNAVQMEIERLDLTKHANKRCGTYSGGNKRKLSTAIALVGNPPILLLDEPTTGMDPATRRFLWDALTGVIRDGRSVILTSHSMEECEALCTRLAIMVNGVFKCLGSVQHIKSKFGSGFTLQMKIQPNISDRPPLDKQSSRSSFRRQMSGSPVPLSPTRTVSIMNPYDTTAVRNFVTTNFPGSLLLEEHQGSVTYHIPGEGVAWSALFRLVEQNKQSLGVIDYSVSQTTLDQVFINFAKMQEEAQL